MESCMGERPGDELVSNRRQSRNGKHFSTRKSSCTSEVDSKLVVMIHCWNVAMQGIYETYEYQDGSSGYSSVLQRETLHATCGSETRSGASRQGGH